jgi:mRNA interferase MazF
MMEGKVVIATISQADGQTKARPAIVLREMPPFDDLLLCGVSTQLHQQVHDFDEVITPGDADFGMSGLRTRSLIRLGYLVVLPIERIMGTIGAIAPERHERLLRMLGAYLVAKL